MIGDEVSVTILGVKGNQVRVGIQAPKSVAVHREEIYKRIQLEREQGQTDRPPPGPKGERTVQSEEAAAPPMSDSVL